MFCQERFGRVTQVYPHSDNEIVVAVEYAGYIVHHLAREDEIEIALWNQTNDSQ